MKTFLMATPQQTAFVQDLFTVLESRYEDLNIQTASNNGEMATMLKNDIYDLAIVNSDKDALALSTEIIASGLAMPILVYTETSYIPFIKKLYGLGVSGVLNIGDGDTELLKAVADVLAKRIYISETVKQELLRATLVINDYKEFADDYDEVNQQSKSLHFTEAKYVTPLTFVDGHIAFFTECLN